VSGLSLFLLILILLVLTWCTAAKYGHAQGYSEGYAKGRQDADEWWTGIERAAEEARQMWP